MNFNRAIPIWLLWGLWLISLLTMPFLREKGISLSLLLSMVIFTQSALVTGILLKRWGTQRTLLAFLLVTALTFLAEVIGVHTGFPFGSYAYTDLLTPQLVRVPLLIPLAWWMTLPASWGIASRIFLRFSSISHPIGILLLFALISAFAMTAWDLFLDPQMVEWGVWKWQEVGGYFGIPLQNYFGWWLTSFLVTFAVFLLVFRFPRKNRDDFSTAFFLLGSDRERFGSLPLVYLLLWLMNTFAFLFFWRMPGPALAGFIGMGIFIGLKK